MCHEKSIAIEDSKMNVDIPFLSVTKVKDNPWKVFKRVRKDDVFLTNIVQYVDVPVEQKIIVSVNTKSDGIVDRGTRLFEKYVFEETDPETGTISQTFREDEIITRKQGVYVTYEEREIVTRHFKERDTYPRTRCKFVREEIANATENPYRFLPEKEQEKIEQFYAEYEITGRQHGGESPVKYMVFFTEEGFAAFRIQERFRGYYLCDLLGESETKYYLNVPHEYMRKATVRNLIAFFDSSHILM